MENERRDLDSNKPAMVLIRRDSESRLGAETCRLEFEEGRGEDLRVRKTRLSLLSALVTLLEKRNFNKITTNDLCKEAMVGRASFYSHFRDKYDLLELLLGNIRKSIIIDITNYNELKTTVNDFIHNNKRVIKNLVLDANSETLGLIQDMMVKIMQTATGRKCEGQENANTTILHSFCTGGLIQLLLWQINNDFPDDKQLLTDYLYKMIKLIAEWNAKESAKN